MLTNCRTNILVPTPLSFKFVGDRNSGIVLGPWVGPSQPSSSSQHFFILKYHWSDRARMHKDWVTIKREAHEILSQMTEILNAQHGVSYSEKSWNFIIGHWLLEFCTVVFDRLAQIESAHLNYGQISHQTWDFSFGSQAPLTSQQARQLFVDDIWNEGLSQRISAHIPEIISAKNGEPLPPVPSAGAKSIIQQLHIATSAALLFTLKIISRLFSKESEKTLVVAGIPMSFGRHLKLVWAFGRRVDFVNPNDDFLTKQFSSVDRQWRLPIPELASRYSKIVRDLIPEYLPVVFWEGYSEAKAKASDLFPNTVSEVFTSNAHFRSDSFRIAVEDLRMNGTRLIVGQHGGGALHKINCAIDWEIEVSDFCLTNGPLNNVKGHMKSVGQFWSRINERKGPRFGPPVLVTGLMPRYVFDLRTMALPSDQEPQFKMQIDFYSSLPVDIQSQLRVRLYPKGDYGWNQKSRWAGLIPDKRIDSANVSFAKSVRRARIVIVDYQASTYAELLAANVPTLMMWDPTIWEATESANGQFLLLHEAGILHYSAASAAEHLSRIWGGIDDWWQSSKTQNARKEFCDSFAVREKDSARAIANVILGLT